MSSNVFRNGYLAIKEDDTYKETGKAFDFDRWNYISYTINNYTLVLYYNDYKTSFDLNYECNKMMKITLVFIKKEIESLMELM